MEDSKNEIETSTKNLASDIGESFFDLLLNDGVIKNIPIGNTIINIFNIVNNIQERFLLKKLEKFLLHIQDIPREQKQKFIEKINSNPKYEDKVEESLILTINRFEESRKADYLGKLFRALLCEKIDYDLFQKLAKILAKSFVPDLDKLLLVYHDQKHKLDITDEDNLYNLGLLNNMGIKGHFDMKDERGRFEINILGKHIVEIILLV